jgi:hypothetical protein
MNLAKTKNSTKQKLRSNAYERVRERKSTQAFLHHQKMGLHRNLITEKDENFRERRSIKPKQSSTQLRKTNWVTEKPCDQKAKRKKRA